MLLLYSVQHLNLKLKQFKFRTENGNIITEIRIYLKEKNKFLWQGDSFNILYNLKYSIYVNKVREKQFIVKFKKFFKTFVLRQHVKYVGSNLIHKQ